MFYHLLCFAFFITANVSFLQKKNKKQSKRNKKRNNLHLSGLYDVHVCSVHFFKYFSCVHAYEMNFFQGLNFQNFQHQFFKYNRSMLCKSNSTSGLHHGYFWSVKTHKTIFCNSLLITVDLLNHTIEI